MNRNGKSGRIVFFVALAAAVLYLCVRLFSVDDESRIRKVVYSGVVGFEREDIFRCASIISDNYSDQYGNSKASFIGIIKDLFSDYSDLRVEIKQLQINVEKEGSGADVGFVCYFKKTGEKQIYYDKGKLKIIFRKEAGHWKIFSVDYSGSKDILFIQSVA